MALVRANRVRESSTTTGTGTMTLNGPFSDFRSFSSGIGVNNTCFYVIINGSEFEVGVGTLTSATTLTRDIVLDSSNANALVNFSAGTKNIFVDEPAQNFKTDSNGILTTLGGGTGVNTLPSGQYVKGAGTSPVTTVATIPNTDITGLGTMSTQSASSVAITGGTITGISSLSATGQSSLSGLIFATSSLPTADAFLYRPSDNTLVLGVGSTEKARITTTGITITGNINLSSLASGFSDIAFQTASVNRWIFEKVGAESGANAGGNLSVYRYTDAGAYLGEPININRSTGLVTLESGLAGGTTIGGISVGNATGQIPVSNGVLNTNLNADLLDGLSTGNASGQIPVSNGILNTNLNADLLDGLNTGNATGQIPVSNGVLNTNLNADLLDGVNSSQFARVDSTSNFTTVPTILGQTVWRAGNDGSGSGLDADLLDGLNSTAFAQLSGAAFTGPITVTSNTVRHDGNIFHGRINSNGTANRLPPGWSSSNSSVGVYLITHNLGVTTYSATPVVRVNSASPDWICMIDSTTPTQLVVQTALSGVLANAPFHFMLMLD